MLPTWMSASTHGVTYMVFSLTGFLLLYSIFMLIEMYLMVRAVRQGPEEHGLTSHEPPGQLAPAASMRRA